MGESIMKKFGKRILALGVALGVICGISSVAFAASSLSPTIGGYKAYATATIEQKKASASTTYTGSGAVSVNSKYIVTQYNSNKQKTLTGSKGSYGTVKLSFKAPNDYKKSGKNNKQQFRNIIFPLWIRFRNRFYSKFIIKI